MHKKPRIIIGAAVLATIGALVFYRTSAAASDDGTIIASGTVEATQAELGFQLAARLEQVMVRQGDVIAAGAVIATLENSELSAQRGIASAQAAGAEAVATRAYDIRSR